MRGIRKLFHIFFPSLMSLLFILLSANVASAQPGPDTYQELRTLLGETKAAVSEKNFALALELLSRADQLLNTLEKRSVLDEEAVKWDLAQINLDRADSMENRDQISHFASESIRRWHQYNAFLSPRLFKGALQRQFRLVSIEETSTHLRFRRI